MKDTQQVEFMQEVEAICRVLITSFSSRKNAPYEQVNVVDALMDVAASIRELAGAVRPSIPQ